MRSRSLFVLAAWGPRVEIDRVDLSDGETLQITGSCSSGVFQRLRVVVTTKGRPLDVQPEVVTIADGSVEFHTMVDLADVLDRADITVAARFVWRGLTCRVTWAPTAFTSANAEVIWPVAPDTVRGLQSHLAPEGHRVTIRTSKLHRRPELVAMTLAPCLEVTLIDTPADARAVLIAHDESMPGEPTPTGWAWPEMAQFARDGGRWRLVVQRPDGSEIPVRLPRSDLRHRGTARVMPYVDQVVDAVTYRLSVPATGNGAIGLRSNIRERDGMAVIDSVDDGELLSDDDSLPVDDLPSEDLEP